MGMSFKFFLIFRHYFLRHTKFGDWRVFKNFFFNFGLKSVIEKCVGYFFVYLYLSALFF